jgi:hypothetical protein
MTHLSEEELVLHYYGEEEGDTLAAEHHLDTCGECRTLYASLQRVLNVVDGLALPERDPAYGERVWRRIQAQIPTRRRWTGWLPARARWAAAATAMASLLVVAFFVGRAYPPGHRGRAIAIADPKAGERVLLVAVGDYLERSQMVLVELVNANPRHPLDISAEQERAAGLVSESGLYRQTAEHVGDTAVAAVLDDLDRVLLEIAHSPSRLSPGELETLRQRLEAEGILFKIRVLGANVRNQEESAAPDQKLQTKALL